MNKLNAAPYGSLKKSAVLDGNELIADVFSKDHQEMAALFAAAPAMLEALEKLLRMTHRHDSTTGYTKDLTPSEVYDLVRPVLAQARNETRLLGTKSYTVRWEIDVEAASPLKAAAQALEIQRDPNSTALVFEVEDALGVETRVDLQEVPL